MPIKYFPPSAFYIVYGINDVMTEHARYSSVMLYDAKTKMAAASITSGSKMKVQAKQLLSNHENNDSFYAKMFCKYSAEYVKSNNTQSFQEKSP